MSPSPSGDAPSTPPTVSRMVHYLSYGTPGGEYGSECRAAIVTESDVQMAGRADMNDGQPQPAISVAVLNPTGLFFNQGVLQDESKEYGGTWHWPCVWVEEKS